MNNASAITPEFIRAIPKTDLHVHLDGSLRPATLAELAKAQGVALPSYTEEGLYELVFKEQYDSLADYLHGFQYTCAALQTPEALERAAYELAADSYEEGARYIEPRFAPQLHIHPGLDMPGVVGAVARGLERAKSEYNARLRARDAAEEPEYSFGLVLCAMRHFSASFSRYYDAFCHTLRYSPPRGIRGMASLELAHAAAAMRDDFGLPVSGFDLAGREDGFPAHEHIEAYRHAHRRFLKKTVHAGEAYGAESIFEAITALHAERIGHGYYLFSTEKIGNPAIEDKERYIHELAEYIADQRITIEVCLTSNLQTNPALRCLAEHPVRRMLESKFSVSFCTDNRLVSRTTLCREIGLAVEHARLAPPDLRSCVYNGFKRAFMPCHYLEKREYVRKVIDYYESLEEQYGVSH